MITSRFYFILLICLVTVFSPIQAQEDLPEPQMQSGPGVPPPPGLVVPIDSGIILLLFSGLSLGIFHLSKFSVRKY